MLHAHERGTVELPYSSDASRYRSLRLMLCIRCYSLSVVRNSFFFAHTSTNSLQ